MPSTIFHYPFDLTHRHIAKTDIFLWSHGVMVLAIFTVEHSAISGDPDQTPCSMASDLGMHCLPKCPTKRMLDLCADPGIFDRGTRSI